MTPVRPSRSFAPTLEPLAVRALPSPGVIVPPDYPVAPPTYPADPAHGVPPIDPEDSLYFDGTGPDPADAGNPPPGDYLAPFDPGLAWAETPPDPEPEVVEAWA